MQQLHLYLLDPNGRLLSTRNSLAVVTDKDRQNKPPSKGRFSYDMQIGDPNLFTMTVFGMGENLSNDRIEFYVAKQGAMAVDHRFKLETIKYKDLPDAKDKYGHPILVNGNKVKQYQFKLANQSNQSNINNAAGRPEINVIIVDQYGSEVPFAVIKNLNNNKLYYKFKISNNNHSNIFNNHGLNGQNIEPVKAKLLPTDHIKVYAILPASPSKVEFRNLKIINDDYEVKTGLAKDIIDQTGKIVLNKKNTSQYEHTGIVGNLTGNNAGPVVLPATHKKSSVATKLFGATIIGFLIKKLIF